ncbi:MAG: hypothetical protein M3O72_08545 [Verrucomicrobiota bacterium]|nr:hypothetical protein [Verrucomicrobiota bacterium]
MRRTEFFSNSWVAFIAFPRSTIHPHQRQKVCFRTSRLVVPLLASAYLAFLAINHSSHAQTAASEHIVVTGEPLPSAYGAPTSFSQSRFSPLTNAYVLPPGAVYASLIYEDAVVHFRRPDHDFTQEVELGLPYRINVATETDIEHYGDETQVRSFSIEARYAFADWGKIPLNPTIFAEYKVGGGKILHDEGPPTPAHKFGPGGFDTSMDIPDAYELRLLLSEDFYDRIEWAFNLFFEQETSGDRGREWGFAQSLVMPFWLSHEELKGGMEFLFRSFTDKGIRGKPYNSFVIGPTAAWRPSRNTRFDISPLFGVNHKSPVMQLFVVFSYYFGGGPAAAEEEGAEAPASTRNR